MNHPGDESEIRKHFEYFDRDSNGQIDFMEFKELMQAIAPDSTLKQVGEGFSMVDTDSDGYIDIEEFIAWWKSGWSEF